MIVGGERSKKYGKRKGKNEPSRGGQGKNRKGRLRKDVKKSLEYDITCERGEKSTFMGSYAVTWVKRKGEKVRVEKGRGFKTEWRGEMWPFNTDTESLGQTNCLLAEFRGETNTNTRNLRGNGKTKGKGMGGWRGNGMKNKLRKPLKSLTQGYKKTDYCSLQLKDREEKGKRT